MLADETVCYCGGVIIIASQQPALSYGQLFYDQNIQIVISQVNYRYIGRYKEYINTETVCKQSDLSLISTQLSAHYTCSYAAAINSEYNKIISTQSCVLFELCNKNWKKSNDCSGTEMWWFMAYVIDSTPKKYETKCIAKWTLAAYTIFI